MGKRRYRSLKLILYPNADQIRQIERNLYVHHFVYNACVYYCRYKLEHEGHLPTRDDLNRLCTEIWGGKYNKWMHEGVYENSLNATAKRVHDSCTKGLKKNKNYRPRYKSLRDIRSFGYLSKKDFSVKDVMDNGKLKRYVKLGKFKTMIRARNMTVPTGTLVTCVVGRTRDVHPEYWCVVQYRDPLFKGSLNITGEESVGVDLGVSHIAVLSDGHVFDNDREYKRRQRTYEKLSRNLTKHRMSPDYGKHLSKLQHALHKLKNHRMNRAHEVSSFIANNYNDICMENLSVKQLRAKSKSKGMTHSYDDASLGRLGAMICYKAEDADHRVRFVDPKYTSQLCSRCGALVEKDLSDRVHHCPECGLWMDRDLNAAINILKRGLTGNPSPRKRVNRPALRNAA